jgi:hypothetical protein
MPVSADRRALIASCGLAFADVLPRGTRALARASCLALARSAVARGWSAESVWLTEDVRRRCISIGADKAAIGAALDAAVNAVAVLNF